MEREPIEPAVLAVERFQQEEGHRHRAWSVALIAVCCSLLGAGAVLAAVILAPHWFGSPRTVVVKEAPPPSMVPPAVSQSLYSEPKDPKAAETVPETKPPVTGPASPASNGETTPLNPFSGAIISRTPVPDGWVPGSGPAPTSPPSHGEQGPKPVADSQECVLVTIRKSSSDPEGEAAAVASSLQSAGASVRTAPHYNLVGSAIGVQVIATLPTSSVGSALAKLGSGERWTGGSSERADRIAGIFAARLRDLRAKEAELREKYEDDATEVVVVREEIQKLNQGLAMARAAKSPGIAVILVGIGDL